MGSQLNNFVMERWFGVLFYLAMALLFVWGGAKAIDYYEDYAVYSGWLLPWRTALGEYGGRCGSTAPSFNGSNHEAYMHSIKRCLGRTGLVHRYALKKPFRAARSLYLLALPPSRLVVYGLPQATAQRIDGWIDSGDGLGRGGFQTRRSRDGMSYTAVYRF